MSAMSVEMILKLIDQATAPLRGVISEVEKLNAATGKLNATAPPAPTRFPAGLSSKSRCMASMEPWRISKKS